MNRNYSLTFRSLKLPDDGGQTLKAYMMWVKSHHSIWTAFPNVHKSAYFKRVHMHGIQNFWTSTWFERFVTSSQLGESTPEINNCWASLLLYYLDLMWPNLDSITDHTMDQLKAINRFTNRIKGARFHGLGIATKCLAPDCIEGFIDLYEDIGSNAELTAWITRVFLPKKPM